MDSPFHLLEITDHVHDQMDCAIAGHERLDCAVAEAVGRQSEDRIVRDGRAWPEIHTAHQRLESVARPKLQVALTGRICDSEIDRDRPGGVRNATPSGEGYVVSQPGRERSVKRRTGVEDPARGQSVKVLALRLWPGRGQLIIDRE